MDRRCWVRAGVAGVCALVAGLAAADAPVYTFEQLRAAGIAGFVGRTVTIRAPLTWDAPDVKIPEDPTPADALRRRAGPLAASFDTPAFANVSGSKRMLVAGERVRKVRDAQGVEGYAVGGVALQRGAPCVFIATLRLRAGFKPEMLANPAFVAQCNDPRYWAQTFELEVAAVTP